MVTDALNVEIHTKGSKHNKDGLQDSLWQRNAELSLPLLTIHHFETLPLLSSFFRLLPLPRQTSSCMARWTVLKPTIHPNI